MHEHKLLEIIGSITSEQLKYIGQVWDIYRKVEEKTKVNLNNFIIKKDPFVLYAICFEYNSNSFKYYLDPYKVYLAIKKGEESVLVRKIVRDIENSCEQIDSKDGKKNG